MDRLIYKEADGDLTCRSRDFDKVFPALYAYEELEMTPEDIEQTMLRFISFLMEMTGGRMSKTNYTVQAMVSEANDYFESICDECCDRKHLAEIEKELEKVMAELADERYRHDRYVDFELAESEELRKVKAERDLLLQQLCEMAACDACKHEEKIAEEAPCFNCKYGPHGLTEEETQNNWEWKGA